MYKALDLLVQIYNTDLYHHPVKSGWMSFKKKNWTSLIITKSTVFITTILEWKDIFSYASIVVLKIAVQVCQSTQSNPEKTNPNET